MSRYLRANDVLRTPGKNEQRWRVLSAFPLGGQIKLWDYQKSEEVYRSIRDISLDLVSGRIVQERKSMPTVCAASHNDPALDQQIRTALSQLHNVENLSRVLNLSFAEAYEVAKADALAKDTSAVFASRATLYRYRKRKRSDLPLLQGSLNKGNRRPRYGQQVYDLVVHAATTLFLQAESSWTMLGLTQYINDRALKMGLIVPGQRIRSGFIQKCLKENGVADTSIPRMDPSQVPASKSVARTRIMVQAPFDRVEQDAVHLPFVIDTPEGPFSNVYLIHAIDCCTSMPLGWRLVIGSPSESDGLRCIQSILFSKAADFARLNLKPSVDVFGTPHQLVLDNGPETRGERMRRLPGLGIDLKHCRARHPHEKPFIERLNRSLKVALETLPGCTRMNGKDGQRDPIKLGDICMTAEELERWVVRWYYESWIHSPLERLVATNIHNGENAGDTPATRWAHITEDQPIPMPPTLNAWRLALFEHHERTLSRNDLLPVISTKLL
ncbi:DDE-type integrase/transposase/recombinase [Bordetella sp. 15P40C-2]|uniref:DDE-type integrase/transposase/recombinase n=1 Tax=Bordetella sp. 15P40C-2 TaxID=2572246 RepID=UPI00132BC123|nr:DDE-type integrase/transposase/recombinase [Bordetella sp. 15P40C-2]MVW71513.1 DDE-type integrase/transposase/recombinase [Bordetella sp. 15P40C-2]